MGHLLFQGDTIMITVLSIRIQMSGHSNVIQTGYGIEEILVFVVVSLRLFTLFISTNQILEDFTTKVSVESLVSRIS